MNIKNEFLRFIVSVLLTFVLYYLLVFTIEGTGDKSFSNILESMFIFAVFGLFIVGPSLLFTVYIIYQFLSIKKERSKKVFKILKRSITFICCMALLFFLAMYTDTFG